MPLDLIYLAVYYSVLHNNIASVNIFTSNQIEFIITMMLFCFKVTFVLAYTIRYM